MKLLRLLLVPFALVVVFIARTLYPWKLVRFGEWWTIRLGHLIGNMECYLCERDAGKHPANAFDIWIPVGQSAHSVIQKKYAKVLHTFPRWFGSVVLVVNKIFPNWERHTVQSAQVDRDIFNLWSTYAPHISFTKAEERKGQKLLRSLGIPDGAKWVCLFIRDSAYLKVHYPGMNFSYHDYRDSDISACIPTALMLVDKGYYVVRVGETVGKPFNVKHSKIIDYALMKNRSDFGHLYLGAKCAFALGSHSGFMSIPQIFDRPIGIINYVPFDYMPTFAKGILIWKHHIKNGKRMKPSEIGEAGLFMTGQQFEAAGITLEDNSSQEIFEVAEEMCEEPDTTRQEFWNTYPRQYANGAPLHGKITLRIGKAFYAGLQSNSETGHQGEEPDQGNTVRGPESPWEPFPICEEVRK